MYRGSGRGRAGRGAVHSALRETIEDVEVRHHGEVTGGGRWETESDRVPGDEKTSELEQRLSLRLRLLKERTLCVTDIIEKEIVLTIHYFHNIQIIIS